MAASKKDVPAAAPAITFPKDRILTFKRYAKRRDLLTVLLKDGEEYTHEQIEKLLSDFMKGVK